MTAAEPAVETVRRAARELSGDRSDFDPVVAAAGAAHLVLIGEASHGTHEFYRVRAEITRRLIAEHGFNAVAVEADWPDAWRINRYVRGLGADVDAGEALQDFQRFPRWMWRNADVLDFVGWLRGFNDPLPEPQRAGFYGLDLYSLHASIDAVLRYLAAADPDAATRARARYSCFDRFGEDLQAYGYATSLGLAPSCEAEAIAQLVELRRSAGRAGIEPGNGSDDGFFVEQNARLIANAERYYRAMFAGHVDSWNLRDGHMVETLGALIAFLRRRFAQPRVIVWAHNSHLGDARATDRARAGEHNVGQLVREQYGSAAYLLGFSTYTGTVTAASDWDAPAERMAVRPALEQSYEALLHHAGGPNLLLTFDRGDLAQALEHPRLQRAIGVVYRPATERQSHYYHVRLPAQFDALLHYDRTRAVEPLDRTGAGAGYAGEAPETYPSAL
ncbi:MAG: erythromycin esterase family protein [Gemmatimonadales bacterium]